MTSNHDPLAIYLHLARASEQRRRPLVRDKLLVLAGVTAAERGLDLVAACCRRKVLSHNAGHLVSQYPTLSVALADERFQTFLRQLRRNYPVEKAEHMLNSLGIQLAGERQAYYTDHEYAAALLGTTPDALEAQFGENGSHLEGSDVRDSELVPTETSRKPPTTATIDRWQWVPNEPRSFRQRLWFMALVLTLLALLSIILVIIWGQA